MDSRAIESGPFGEMLPSLKKVAAVFREAEIPFVLGGSVAAWAHGGPETDHDLDFLVKRADAERALSQLVDHGMRREHPPEPWLYKAYDGDVLIDVIFDPAGLEVDDEVIARSPELEIFAVPMRVLRPSDLLVTKLMAMTEHTINYRSCLEIARAVREQIDWDELQQRTSESPFARAFFTLVDGLGIAEAERPNARAVWPLPRRLA
ncbi:MAG TPA: nucleotidyltransferase [Gaiellaceae bacterium]